MSTPNSLVVDYSVYLVTDSKLNHPSRTLTQTIEEAILGGVRIVQLREKELSTDEFILLAKEVHVITKKHGVPLIINDNIDVLLATDAEGLHVGQDDTPYSEARQRVGPSKIIGVSVETVEQAHKAIEDGADYIGIQICYATQTKTNDKPLLGHIGVREILESISVASPIKTVAIGGIQHFNTRRLVRSSSGSNGRVLDGVAVVSSIVSEVDAKLASARLLREFNLGKTVEQPHELSNLEDILTRIPQLLLQLRKSCPLTYHITNYVVMNDTANSTLAFGGSPIMSSDPVEAEDLSKIASSVVLNIGTLTEPFVECMLEAGKHANAQSKPVVFDPVGAGATTLRRQTTRRILNSVHVNIIKGNSGEISAIADIIGCANGVEPVTMRGVDSVDMEITNAAAVVRMVAKRERCVVVMTGKVDYISDGTRTVAIENGHDYQRKITGSGCMATAAIASFAGVSEDHFIAAIAGIMCINLAAEHAVNRADVKGPGTFRAAFIDEIANLHPDGILPEFRVLLAK